MNNEEKQVKNLKNKIIDFIYKASTENLIKFAVNCSIKVPKQLIDKYLSSKIK